MWECKVDKGDPSEARFYAPVGDATLAFCSDLPYGAGAEMNPETVEMSTAASATEIHIAHAQKKLALLLN